MHTLLFLAALALCLPLGCTRAGFSADDAHLGPDRWTGADTSVDFSHLTADNAADKSADRGDTTRCRPWDGTGAFSPPEPVTELNSPSKDGKPWLAPDRLTIFFISSRPGTMGSTDIYYASRSSESDPFGNPTNLTALNSSAAETALALTPDGQTAFISTARAGGLGLSDIWVATRASVHVPFDGTTLKLSAILSSVNSDLDPFVTYDGLHLYLAVTDLAGGAGAEDLAVATRGSLAEDFGEPAPLPGVNTAGNEANPSLTADGLLLFFNTKRVDSDDPADIWYARRSTTAETFADAQPLPGVNSPSHEGETFITADGCTLYFSSDRPGGQGEWDIYRSQFVHY